MAIKFVDADTHEDLATAWYDIDVYSGQILTLGGSVVFEVMVLVDHFSAAIFDKQSYLNSIEHNRNESTYRYAEKTAYLRQYDLYGRDEQDLPKDVEATSETTNTSKDTFITDTPNKRLFTKHREQDRRVDKKDAI